MIVRQFYYMVEFSNKIYIISNACPILREIEEQQLLILNLK